MTCRTRKWGIATACFAIALSLGAAGFGARSNDAQAGPWRSWFKHRAERCGDGNGDGVEVGGTWQWLRSPDEEQRVVASIFNRYCIRCHGVDGRGRWDIPDVPNFTNAAWVASRSDDQFARRILEGRGAVMPPFRGTLSLEEAYAMARYIRTFPPNTIVSRPDFTPPKKIDAPPK